MALLRVLLGFLTPPTTSSKKPSATSWAECAGDWQSAGLHANSRGVVVMGLTPGTNYTFQIRAMGGSTGQSDWSNPVSHMSL